MTYCNRTISSISMGGTFWWSCFHFWATVTWDFIFAYWRFCDSTTNHEHQELLLIGILGIRTIQGSTYLCYEINILVDIASLFSYIPPFASSSHILVQIQSTIRCNRRRICDCDGSWSRKPRRHEGSRRHCLEAWCQYKLELYKRDFIYGHSGLWAHCRVLLVTSPRSYVARKKVFRESGKSPEP